MRRTPEQLRTSLKKELAPVYLITGDEPLQSMECQDAIRAAARAQGYGDRTVLDVETGIDWPALRFTADSLSLFSSRQLIELRLGDGKPGAAGAEAIIQYCERPSPDVMLLISSGKLDGKTLQTGWTRAIDARGVLVQVWPLKAGEMAVWIRARLQVHGVDATPDAVRLLADRDEGNLLAAAQDIDKLALLYGGKTIDVAEVMAAVGNSARYDLFSLPDSALAGDAARAVRMLRGLRDEGVEPVLVCWNLTRELRALNLLAQGRRPEENIPGYKMFGQRESLLKTAARRLGAEKLKRLLREAIRVDRVVKGVAQGQPWEELTGLCLNLAGKPLFQSL
ncbi:MAG TPA: DNA polymerase III subunit delta [Gammaproteobacteria bacterium]|nr:DNA polymerase III subunit delta [Gammaproteobacteria bacterium]